MEFIFRLLPSLVLLCTAGLTDVLAASRSKMSGDNYDASDITWAHAVNSRDALEKALDGPVDFLEADISMGEVSGERGFFAIPIMAHPPDTTSDISLDTWLNSVASKRPDKGLKLDFKSIDVLEVSLMTLLKYSSKLTSSVWLNADVISGPVHSPTTPVPVDQFLSLCQQYFPNATLSIGWTTYWSPTIDEYSWHYGWQHVRRMADVIRCRGYEGSSYKFTFPVRGIYASRSIKQLHWLLSVIPSASLTVWTGQQDPLELEDLLKIRSSFPKDRVYYDVPESINTVFKEKKNSVGVTTYDFNADDRQWMTLTKGQGESCLSSTYVKNDTVLFGKSLITAVLQKNLIILGERDHLKVTGRINFFRSEGSYEDREGSGAQELSIVLADVSLFSKNASDDSKQPLDLTSSDTEVIWSAINSSIIYTFRHKYTKDDSQVNKGVKINSSCRLFKLNTSEDKSFEVWTVPCDATLKERSFEEISKDGISEISSRKRLVLPKSPFIFGFTWAGDENVAIYDLKLNGHKEAFSSGSNSVKTSFGLLAMLVAFFCALL